MMDAVTSLVNRLAAYGRKNLAVILLLLVGAALLLLPSGGAGDAEESQPQQQTEPLGENGESRSLEQTEQMLAELLSSIDGAGRVKVMLSLETKEETVYAADLDSDRSSTVIISAGSQTQQAVVSSVNCAKYRGAVVIAQGADSPTVRLMITQAISALTGLGADSISVLKMQN